MTMGELIRKNRIMLDMTQEELGEKLNPKVNRAAINKWETGQVENLKRSHIEQLSRIFDITPSELMCFDDTYDSRLIAEEAKTIELVQKHFGKDAVKLLQEFQNLNVTGRIKILDQVEDLLSLPKYCENNES